MKEYTECPNCQTTIKSGFLSSVSILDPTHVNLINEYANEKKETYCSKCGLELFAQSKIHLQKELHGLNEKFARLIKQIPVISVQSPLNWEYDILELVTGQSTTGTGVISEFTSSFTDLFGKQSGRFNSKLRAGEDIALAILRNDCVSMNGNAVIAVDIDYAEVGGEKGMLMVCATGTAIKLKNTEILGDARMQAFSELEIVKQRRNQLFNFL